MYVQSTKVRVTTEIFLFEYFQPPLENDEFIADSGAEIVKVQDNDDDEYEEDDEEENLIKAFIPFGNYW